MSEIGKKKTFWVNTASLGKWGSHLKLILLFVVDVVVIVIYNNTSFYLPILPNFQNPGKRKVALL